MPALRPAAAHVLVAVDTSASINEAQLQQFWAEIQSLAGQVSMQLTLLAADTKLAAGAPWVFAPGEVPLWPHPHGQGGTDFRPVFAWLEQYGEGVDALIYFTDGKGDYPLNMPSVPVLWALAGEGGNTRRPPFGEVAYL
jgi:predicted metal-dependent peptidase